MEKTQGAVGCGHCQKLGARETCPVCGRPVCATCLEQEGCPETPAEPAYRELRLGVGARLRHVDSHGRYGLVTTWTGRCKLLDLSTGETVARRLPVSFRGPEPPPRLVAGKRLAFISNATLGPGLLDGLQLMGLDGRADWAIPISFREDFKAMEVSEDGTLVALVRTDETVEVFDVPGRAHVGTYQVRGRVVHAAAVCAGNRLVAIGTYGRVSLFDLDDHRTLGTCSLKDDGDIRWVGLGRRRLAAITENARCVVVDIDRERPASRWRRHPRSIKLLTSVTVGFVPWLTDDALNVGAMDAAGELLALPVQQLVMVYRLSTGRAYPLFGHTDDISLLRFVDDARTLVSADDDARARLWPLVDGAPVSQIPA